MVVFENGRPLKSAYRRFLIKTVQGQDDYGSMREVLTRRLTEYEVHKEEGKGFGRLPDLILLDGGKGHVAAVKPVVDSFHLDIPVFGMVKDISIVPGAYRGGRRGDRHQFQAHGFHPDILHPGGGPSLGHRLPPTAAEEKHHRHHADPD